MTDRERLLQILNVPIHPHLDVDPLEAVADYLLDNGITFAKDTNVPSWIPVSERLPRPNKLVLCWWESGDGEKEHYGFATFQSHGVWYVSNEGMPKVTHWMPLPEPPKEE